MSWDERDFFQAFAEEGMLDLADFTDSDGVLHKDVHVGFQRPDTLMLNEMVQVAAYQIEYETATLPGLGDGMQIMVSGVAYRVAGNPQRRGNGYFSVADLTRER